MGKPASSVGADSSGYCEDLKIKTAASPSLTAIQQVPCAAPLLFFYEEQIRWNHIITDNRVSIDWQPAIIKLSFKKHIFKVFEERKASNQPSGR